MTFREQLLRDARDVFLNPSEFAEIGELAGHDGISLLVAPCELQMPPDGDSRQGVSYESVAVVVHADDVPETLLTGRATTLNGEEWTVLSATARGEVRRLVLWREKA
ncbi:hypothetical protein [uncultured Desulfovibrio sp.]|nr:hypothetical protein [uncultured Desulfovibrio sp.]